MNENRRKILQMLSEGQITADEAERLLAALDRDEPESRPKAKPKYLRVVVDADGANPKVNVRVPMQLLRAGVKLTSLIPAQARIQINSALHREGIDIDVTQLKPENLEELIENLGELTVDVDDKDAHVRVFCE